MIAELVTQDMEGFMNSEYIIKSPPLHHQSFPICQVNNNSHVRDTRFTCFWPKAHTYYDSQEWEFTYMLCVNAFGGGHSPLLFV